MTRESWAALKAIDTNPSKLVWDSRRLGPIRRLPDRNGSKCYGDMQAWWRHKMRTDVLVEGVAKQEI